LDNPFQAGRWLTLGTSLSSTNETDRHDIAETLLKVALNTISQQTIFFLGYTGFVPRSRGQPGMGYPIITQLALNEFTDDLIRVKSEPTDGKAANEVSMEAYTVAVSFIGGGMSSTQSKPPSCRKSLTDLIINCCFEYTSS
jgi:hypothetical protein